MKKIFNPVINLNLDTILSSSDSPTFANLYIDTTGVIGIGSTAPDKKLEINTGAATDGMRISYNDANGSATTYADFLLDSGGDLHITPTGTLYLESTSEVVKTGGTGTNCFSTLIGSIAGGDQYVSWQVDDTDDRLELTRSNVAIGEYYIAMPINIYGNIKATDTTLGFYGVTPVTRQVLATGAGATVDNVITTLQNLGLLSQS